MSAQPNPSAERVPERIGRYEILLPIGTGGMATVYLARTEVVAGMHRFVALKMMHPQLNAGGEAAWQLIEEAKLSASIKHPHVVTVYEAAEDPWGVYMVMDYVEGETLSGLIRAARAAGERLPLPIVGRILSDALLGLHAAHELTDAAGKPVNLVHRDYSPSNILVGVDGLTRLADFGVAKAESRVSATTSGAIKGKIGYMAPEQVLAKKLDRRCDVWAAGVVAWECLAGRRLHQDEDQVAALFRIVQEEPPLLATERPDLPEAIGAAIAAALTRDIESRCPTAAELRRRLTGAWGVPFADTEQVSEYVARIPTGDRLRMRRQKIANVLDLRSQLASVSHAAMSAVADTGSPALAVLLAPAPSRAQADSVSDRTTDQMTTPDASREPPTVPRPAPSPSEALSPPAGALPPPPDALSPPALDTRSPSPPERQARPARSPYRLAALGTLGLVAVGSVVAYAGLDGERAVASAPASAVASGVASVPSNPPSASPPPAATSASAAPRAPVVVRASAPIASIQIGARTIAMAQPAREVEIMLTDAEQAGPLHVEAAATDGRRASADLAPGAAAIELSFASATRGSGPPQKRGGAPAPAPPAVGDAPPRLAPSPFGNH